MTLCFLWALALACLESITAAPSKSVAPPKSAAAAAPALGLDRKIWISPRTDEQSGSGTLADPFNGAGDRFDAKLRELSLSAVTNLSVHILPGVYETKGVAMWSPRSGWRIEGAGKDLTVLRLTNVNFDSWAVIGTPLEETRHGIVVSDLTVDCNYGPNNQSFALAVNLNGFRHTIRRVKALNAYGQYGVFETFVLAISSTGEESEGNLIEECEVSNFKGTYGVGIGLGSNILPSAKGIEGIIRNNYVSDFKGNGAGPSSLVGYSAAGLKNVVIEGNAAVRCDVGVHIDTGSSRNVIFRNNRFINCRVRGIGIYGHSLDNLVFENNLIEMDPSSRDWGLTVYDVNGRNKMTNFKIRNNILRTVNGLASLGGGIGISVLNGETFHVTGNRTDPSLRSFFSGSGIQLVDNTDFSGKPLRTLPGLTANALNFPLGESGTLLLNKGPAHVIVENGPNPVANGTNLISAYLRAGAMLPHGQALSPTNRAVVLLMPGKYVLPDSALRLDTECVDLIGMGDAKSVRLESDGNTLVQTASDVLLANLSVHCQATAWPTMSAHDKAAYFPEGNLAQTVVKNCIFSGENYGWSMRLGINYAGHYENCVSGPRGWGSAGGFSGSALNCTADANSFASGGIFTGGATNCTAGPGSFGAGGGFHGIVKGCVAGHDSFGGSGSLIACQVAGAVNSSVPTTGKLIDCHIGPAPPNVSAIVLGPGARIYNCTLLADSAGNGFSVDAPSPVRAKIGHCRLNRSMRNVINDLAQSLNIDDPSLE